MLDCTINTKHCAALGGLSARITSPYGARKHPITGEQSFHSGVDLVPCVASTDALITAVRDCIVIDGMNEKDYAPHANDPKYGKGVYVRVRYIDGQEAYYLHMSCLYCHIGDYIPAGGVIGKIGSTGSSTDIHLHYQLYDASKTIISPV